MGNILRNIELRHEVNAEKGKKIRTSLIFLWKLFKKAVIKGKIKGYSLYLFQAFNF